MNLPRRRVGPPRRKKHPIQPPWLLAPYEEIIVETGPARTDPEYRQIVDRVRARAEGRCEAGLEGCTTWGAHPHHVVKVSKGGRVACPDVWLKWVCAACHGRIHSANGRAEAETLGLLAPFGRGE